MTKYDWLFFDADNTLFDYDAAEEFAVTKTLLHFDVACDRERKDRYKELDKRYWAAYAKGDISQEALLTERFSEFLSEEGILGDAKAWNDYYLHTLSENSVLLPGAEKMLRKLAPAYTLVLATNGVSSVQRPRLAASPLADFFGDRIFISEELGVAKPDRAFFEKIFSSLCVGTKRNRVLMIGDSLHTDIRGAFNARIDSCWFNRHGETPGTVTPTYEVYSLSELTDLLWDDGLWRGRGPFYPKIS